MFIPPPPPGRDRFYNCLVTFTTFWSLLQLRFFILSTPAALEHKADCEIVAPFAAKQKGILPTLAALEHKADREIVAPFAVKQEELRSHLRHQGTRRTVMSLVLSSSSSKATRLHLPAAPEHKTDRTTIAPPAARQKGSSLMPAAPAHKGLHSRLRHQVTRRTVRPLLL